MKKPLPWHDRWRRWRRIEAIDDRMALVVSESGKRKHESEWKKKIIRVAWSGVCGVVERKPANATWLVAEPVSEPTIGWHVEWDGIYFIYLRSEWDPNWVPCALCARNDAILAIDFKQSNCFVDMLMTINQSITIINKQSWHVSIKNLFIK